MHNMNFPCLFMIEHCYAVSGESPILSLIPTLFTLLSFTFMYLYLENKNQTFFKLSYV